MICLCSWPGVGSLIIYLYTHEMDPFISGEAFALLMGFLGWFVLGIYARVVPGPCTPLGESLWMGP